MEPTPTGPPQPQLSFSTPVEPESARPAVDADLPRPFMSLPVRRKRTPLLTMVAAAFLALAASGFEIAAIGRHAGAMGVPSKPGVTGTGARHVPQMDRARPQEVVATIVSDPPVVDPAHVVGHRKGHTDRKDPRWCDPRSPGIPFVPRTGNANQRRRLVP